MSADAAQRWQRGKALGFFDEGLGLGMELGALGHDRAAFDKMEGALQTALERMTRIEAGAVANEDEGRMVGHYWLRASLLAPTEAIRADIDGARAQLAELVDGIAQARIRPERAERFTQAVLVGIGGSSLGPQLVYDALGGQGLTLWFVDNTDPDGIDRLLARLGDALEQTLVVVISKSGGTKETRNGMLEMRHAFEARGLSFGPHAVAVTSSGSKLDRIAEEQGFVARLPMWDWVGGRTSVTSAVGLLPAALQGADIDALLDGAAAMDALTRKEQPLDNPAALLAASWFLAGEGRGRRAMVVLPYKDRLALMARYLQQLVMESLGKRKDRSGADVFQGLAVYGNKGSTDQHAYVQQLLDGPDNFFITFLQVLQDRQGASIEVEPGVSSGDYLFGFLRGTRRALAERGRGSLTIWLEQLDARGVGALIALYERAVGLYAELINVNAYHQPAVESGKRAAAETLALRAQVLDAATAEPMSIEQLAAAAGSEDYDEVLAIALHAAQNGKLVADRPTGSSPWSWRFSRPA